MIKRIILGGALLLPILFTFCSSESDWQPNEKDSSDVFTLIDSTLKNYAPPVSNLPDNILWNSGDSVFISFIEQSFEFFDTLKLISWGTDTTATLTVYDSLRMNVVFYIDSLVYKDSSVYRPDTFGYTVFGEGWSKMLFKKYDNEWRLEKVSAGSDMGFPEFANTPVLYSLRINERDVYVYEIDSLNNKKNYILHNLYPVDSIFKAENIFITNVNFSYPEDVCFIAGVNNKSEFFKDSISFTLERGVNKLFIESFSKGLINALVMRPSIFWVYIRN